MDKKTEPEHMLPTRDPSQKKTPTQSEGKGLRKNIPRKWAGKRIWNNKIYIRQDRLQNKGHKKRYRRTLHNTQGKNLSRHNYYTDMCTQYRST